MDEGSGSVSGKILFWGAGSYVVLLLIPVQFPVSRVLIVVGAFALWGGALFVWWRRRAVRIALLALFGICLALVALPGRPPDQQALRADYRRALLVFGQAKYFWGGETPLGVDCSGLVREGLVGGQLLNGVRTLNGTPIRDALWLWWHDASAQALLDGYRDMTVPLGEFDSVNDIDPGIPEVGDLVVTADGKHVMVYVGEETWLEADPAAGRVIEDTVPSDISWFETPVVLMRWSALAT